MSLKLEPLVVVGAVVTVAASVAVTLWAGAGLAWPYAALAALGVTALMMPLALRAPGGAPRGSVEAQRKLEAGIAGLSRRLQEVERRLVELDHRMIDVSRTTVRAVATELDTVGAVMRDLAQAVALHDAELFAPRSAREAAAKAAPEPVAPAPREAEAAPSPAARFSAEEIDAVSRALRTEQLELMLQAVVTLPQRRVRLYEAQTRVRLPSGLHAEDRRVSAIAVAQGQSRELDRFVLYHAMRVARHLASRNRDVPVLFRPSPTALLDGGLFRLLSDAVAADAGFASRILFEMPLSAFRDAAALEREALDALDALGIRFVLDDIPDLVLEARPLAARGVRYVRVSAATLLGAAAGTVRTEIHPADLAGYLARHGLTLVVDGVDSEQVSMELIEFDVPLGIGSLYAPPRTVRMDVLDAPPPPGEASPAEPETPATPQHAATPQPVATPAAEPAAGDSPAADTSPAGPATQPRGTSLRAFLRRTSG